MAIWGIIKGYLEFDIVNFDYFDVRKLIQDSLSYKTFGDYSLRIADNYNESGSGYEGDIYLILRCKSHPASHNIIELHPRIALRHVKKPDVLFEIEKYLLNIFNEIKEDTYGNIDIKVVTVDNHLIIKHKGEIINPK